MSHAPRTWLTASLAAFAWLSSAKAELITPDSIAAPLAVSAAAQGSPVVSGGWATNQYQNLGILFDRRMTGVDTGVGAAVVTVNGLHVWTGATYADGGILSRIAFEGQVGVSAALTTPGTTDPSPADGLRVDYLSAGPGIAALQAFDRHGQLLATTTAPLAADLDSVVSLHVAGTYSFQATVFQAVVDPPVGGDAPFQNFGPAAWGVRSIECEHSPEPTALALGGLGMLGLIGYACKRRSKRVRLTAVAGSVRPH